jgi:hypothetical protein
MGTCDKYLLKVYYFFKPGNASLQKYKSSLLMMNVTIR